MDLNNLEFTIENHVLKGTELSYSHDFASLGEFVLDRLGNNKDLIGQIDASTGEEWTYGKMRDRSVRCALWMKSQGFRPGDVVAVCSELRHDFATPCFAALYLGAAFSYWSVAMKTAEFRHHAKIAKPKMIFVSEDAAAAVAEALEQENLDSDIVVIGTKKYESIIAMAEDDEVKNFKCVRIESLTEIAVIFFSSGTTSLPKGVALSHGALLRQLKIQAGTIGMGGQVILSFDVPHWITGLLLKFSCLYFDKPRILPPPFEANSACSLMEKYQVNWLFVSPAMINELLRSDALHRHDLSSLSQIVHAGASLANASREAFVELLPKVLVTAAYGMTELGGYVSIQSGKSKLGSCGQIANNIQLKVVHPDTGKTLGVDQRGELLLKSPFMMNFYYGNPDATAKTVDEQGWLRSGDLGYYDRDGEIFLVEKLKDLIEYRNHQMAPSEIENVILSHPGVADTSVVSVPHPRDDERPVAFVVRKNDVTGRQVTESELIDLVAAELSDSKRLRCGVRFVDRLPRTSTGKIERKVLHDLAESTMSSC